MQRVMKDGLFGGGFGGPRCVGRPCRISAFPCSGGFPRGIKREWVEEAGKPYDIDKPYPTSQALLASNALSSCFRRVRNSRERGARSNFQPNSIDPGRLTEPTGQLSASKRGTNFRKVLQSINFSPPQAFDENGVHLQCRGHLANDVVIP